MFEEVEDPLEDLDLYANKPKYYRLNEKVFAEPIANISENEVNDCKASDEESFIDNFIIKKRASKRNKYIINVNRTSTSPKCPQMNCNKIFATATLLRAHIRRVHCAERNKYICEQCAAGFSANYLLQRHMAVHSQQKSECPVCGKMLSKRTNMSAHVKCHTSARQHVCQLCRRAFVRRATLNTHVRFVHRTGELRCHICHEEFSSRKLLMNHKTCQTK